VPDLPLAQFGLRIVGEFASSVPLGRHLPQFILCLVALLPRHLHQGFKPIILGLQSVAFVTHFFQFCV
jgi:hypothetical protein